MHLHCQLIAETPDSSLSTLTTEGRFVCFILEDGYREKKVMHETRIPPGLYNIIPRREGKFFEAHKRRFGHKFVPHIDNVPGFTFILQHPGVTVADTSGCQLTGYQAVFNKKLNRFSLAESAVAFQALYDLIDAAFSRGEGVTIRVSRELVFSGE
mgnify:CR=1 FL=1